MKLFQLFNRFKKQFFALSFLTCAHLVQAQEVENDQGLITDRPDQTESPSLVSKRTLQIETGFLYESYSENEFSEKTYAYNITLLRYGVFDNLEFRLGLDYLGSKVSSSEIENESTVSGLGPILVGAKIGIRKQEGILPEMGVMAHLYLPFTANKNFKPATTGGEIRFAFDHVLSERSGLAYNLGVGWDDTPGIKYLYTLVYGYDLTQQLGIYAEIYGELPERSSAEHDWDAGFTYSINPNFQIDAYVGSQVNSSKDLMLGAGLSYRIKSTK